MSDKRCLEDSLHCYHACCKWTEFCAKIWRHMESNHWGILPHGKLGCTSDLVINCRFFPVWSELSFLLAHTISVHPSTLPFVLQAYGKGRVIVCHVTLWMCNAGPRGVLAWHVLICSLTLSLTSTFYIDSTRRRVFAVVALAAPSVAVMNKDKHLCYSRTMQSATWLDSTFKCVGSRLLQTRMIGVRLRNDTFHIHFTIVYYPPSFPQQLNDMLLS